MTVNVSKENGIIGSIKGISSSTAFFDLVEGKIEGKIILKEQSKAYSYFTENGTVIVKEVDIHSVICHELLEAPGNQQVSSGTNKTSAIPSFQSLPGAASVIYIDFDGQVVSGGKWKSGATINAKASGLTDAQMKNAWLVASEDYRPFQVNVTTDEAIYNAAAKNKRMRCIVTPTNDAAPGSGGVAYVGSFDAGDDNTPCWVFNLGGDGKTTGETVSHEVGHTMGLSHDGNSSVTYFSGHGNWAPIMGSSYTKKIGQWSKGEYSGANNKEDDINIIATKNGFTYRPDEAGNTNATAKALTIASGGMINAADNYGIILNSADVDLYSFTAAGGKVTFNVNPCPNHPDLDVLLQLKNSSGTVLATADPQASGSNLALAATLTFTLPSSGTYYLSVDGTGYGDPASTGYSDFSSIGEYTIDGSVPVITGLAPTDLNPAFFSLYPNPTANVLNMIIQPAQGLSGDHSDVRMYNSVGQLVYTQATSNDRLSIDVSDLTNGIYVVTVTNNSGTSTLKFMKE